MNSFYQEDELEELGLRGYGNNVFISRKASIYGASNIQIGSNVRIDDFCILCGNITIGDYVHIAAFSALYGGNVGIILEDFVTISSRNVIYAISDDYSGNSLTNPLVSELYRKPYGGKVRLKKHSIIGTGCTVLPGVVLNEGAAIGAMSLVKHSVESWTINYGIPTRKIKTRERQVLKLEQQLKKELENDKR